MGDTEKKHTLKNIEAERKRLENAKGKKQQKIAELQSEIRNINRQQKELDEEYNRLYQEEMQRQFMAMFPKGTKLTTEQMNKFMQISKHVIEKIDILDTDAATQAIGLACEETSKTAGTSGMGAVK